MLHRGCVVMLLRVLVLVLCMCVLSTLSYETTPPVRPTFPEKPCGEFPWPSEDREYTVNCDYSSRFPNFVDVEPQGRCKVRCPPNSTEFLVGPPFDGNQGLTDGLYYCNRLNGTWLGSQPVCLGFYNNATMVTDESKGIRLVGGASYGYVELFDNVTQQWGPVRGRREGGDDPFDNAQMELVDLACRNLRFSSGLATTAYVRKDWWEDDMWPLEEHYEITPLEYRYRPPGYPHEAVTASFKLSRVCK
ncbi:uncharacterized protein LOC144907538 [Branchiostoma floridae x Branchiostoma belcheri]